MMVVGPCTTPEVVEPTESAKAEPDTTSSENSATRGRRNDFIFRSNKHLRILIGIIGAPRVGSDVRGFGFWRVSPKRCGAFARSANAVPFVGVLRHRWVTSIMAALQWEMFSDSSTYDRRGQHRVPGDPGRLRHRARRGGG